MINSTDIVDQYFWNSGESFVVNIEFLNDPTNLYVVVLDSTTEESIEQTYTGSAPSDGEFTYNTVTGAIETGTNFKIGGAYTVAEKITITTNLAYLQKTDITSNSNYDPEVLEAAFDNAVLLTRQNKEALGRSISLSLSDTGETMVLPSIEVLKNGTLGFDATGTPIARQGFVPPTYDVTFSYPADSIIQYNGHQFKAKGTTTGDTPVGDSTDAYWEMMPMNGMALDLEVYYQPGNIVESGGELFTCQTVDTYGSTPTPIVGDTNWERLFTKGEDGDTQTFNHYTGYNENNKVLYSGKEWISKQSVMGHPPGYDLLLTGVYEEYTNLITDPTDLTTANWINTNSSDVIDVAETENGNLYTKITNVGAFAGYVAQAFTASFVNTVLTGTVSIKKGSSVGNTTTFTVFNVTQAGSILDVVLDFDTYPADIPAPATGTILATEWISSEEVRIHFQCDALTLVTDDISVRCYGSSNATDAEYTYWSEVQLIDHDEVIQFPFVEGTHTADAVSETFTLPDQFTFDMIIDPKFLYTDSGPRLWNMSGSQYITCKWDSVNDSFEVEWIGKALVGGAFDDGTTKTLNQRIRVIGSIDLTTGTTLGSRLIIIPLEQGAISEDTVWDAVTAIKTADLTTLDLGHYSSGSQANSDFEYLRFFDGLLVGAVADSDDADTLLADMGQPIFETFNEGPTDYWQVWPSFGVDTGEIRFELPLVTTTERNAIASPLVGTMVYNTTQDRINVRADNSSSPRWEYPDGTDAT